VRKLSTFDRNSPESATNPTVTLTVLSVSPAEKDHSSLRDIIGDGNGGLLKASDIIAAFALLQQHDVAVVVCERDLLPGTYIDLLEQIKAMPNPPLLIVASRLADERLWAEALNLGAWDVLATPLDRNELIRSIASAWRHWHHRRELLNASRSRLALVATGT
jgi:DNA-binding NtrC family response regulator